MQQCDNFELNADSQRMPASVDKIREIMMRNCDESECGDELPELDFVYADCEPHLEEMAQLYSYGECADFVANLACFDELMVEHGFCRCWQSCGDGLRRRCVLTLLDLLDVASAEVRLKAMRALLYIGQGCFAEVQSDVAQMEWARQNVVLLVRCGAVPVFVQLLQLELQRLSTGVPGEAASAGSSTCTTPEDGTALRIVLNMLYTLIETMRVEPKDGESSSWEERELLRAELSQPMCESGELLVVTLLGMVARTGQLPTPQLPMKKILLLVWKTLLFTLGDSQQLNARRRELRQRFGLGAVPEDTVQHTRTISSCSVSPHRPGSASSGVRGSSGARRIALTKQPSLDEQAELELENQQRGEEEGEETGSGRCSSPRPSSSSAMDSSSSGLTAAARRLPWTPKVRRCDVVSFIDNARRKFVGFSLEDDDATTAGLPPSIREGVRVLNSHVYSSLSEVQIQREEEIERYPFSRKEEVIEQNAVEVLYVHLLPTLPQCVIALLKVLLAAAPTSKVSAESIDIMPEAWPQGTRLAETHTMCLGMHLNRQKEIIVKAVSAIILLILKHFKQNHVYQFEYVSQHLVFANCIPLVLKFFSQETMCYVTANNSIPVIDFPSCVIGEQPELLPENLENNEQVYSWRNLFASINLLRILNKLCKWKPSRAMMLVVFKSAPTLKRLLLLKQPMVQVYTLKLLKMQTKYLGRQWRKTNMRTVSAIYEKVRHHFNDDWAFGNDVEARPWDFRAEERQLRLRVERFNERRYSGTVPVASAVDVDAEHGGEDTLADVPLEFSITEALARPVHLNRQFKRHYDVWLEREVFQNQINWDVLIEPGYVG